MVKISKVFDKLESFADDKLQKLNVRGGNNPLIFPTEIENVGQFIKFSVFKEYQFQRDAFEKAEIVGTVVLPLPSSLAASYSSEYANEELGVFGMAASQNAGALDFSGDLASSASSLSNFAQGTADSVGTKGLASVAAQAASTEAGGVIGSMIGGITGGVAGAAVGQTIKGAFAGKGVARNPHMAVLFQGTGFRTHAFSFKLVPSRQEESRTITKIIRTFKHATVPEYIEANHFFRYPQQFRIELSKPDHLFKFQTCVLTGFNVNYHGEGAAFYHSLENGEEAPVSVTVEMNFTETRIITKKEIDEGL